MTTRLRFKIDSVHLNKQHVDYELDEQGFPVRTKPTFKQTATVNLSAVDPGRDPERKHENSQVWKSRASGRIVLTDMELSVLEALLPGQEIKGGEEFFIDVSPAPVG